uniref:C1 family peptidase n=1 Tax=Methylobacterium sp. B34 TaxID=95563 RepID=UPI0009FDC39F
MAHKLRGLRCSISALVCLAGLIGGPAFTQPADGDADEQGTGVQPLSAEEFARLPKTPEYRAFLPERVDLASRFPIAGNQGRQGSCVAWAVGYAARAYYAEVAEDRNVRDPKNIPSPAYIYNIITDNNYQCNSGSRISAALNLLRDKGSLSLSNYPYDALQCHRPNIDQQRQANDFKIERWLAVDYSKLDQIKGELAKGHPVIVSVRLSKAFHRLHAGEIYQVVGGHEEEWHAIPIVGYDEKRQAFKFLNSWGPGWGDHGFGWISYASFQSEVREAYVMRPLKPVIPQRKETPVPSPPVVQIKPPPPSPLPVPVVHIDPKPSPTPTTVPVAKFECGHVEGKRQGEKVTFSGFVGSDSDLQTLKERAQAMNAEVDVAVRPWPQCEVLLTLEKALAQVDRPKIKIEGIGKDTREGEYLRITVESPTYPSFLHAAYIQADGSVVHLVQPDSLHL